jgi:hypothetical protein
MPSFSVGMSYNKSFTNPKGQIIVTVPQAGGVLYIKSNSISSMAVSGKNSTIYTKSTVYEVLNNGSTVAIDGGVSLRLDTVDGSPDQVGVTVLSSTSVLYYSNNWTLFNNAWRTGPEALSHGQRRRELIGSMMCDPWPTRHGSQRTLVDVAGRRVATPGSSVKAATTVPVGER